MTDKPKMEINIEDLEGLLSLELADGGMGYYPQSVHHGDGTITHRTEKQEGHNECVSEFHAKRFRIWDWLSKKVPEEHKAFLYPLMIDEKIWMNVPHSKDEEPYLWILCNDVFCYAADGEDISLEQIPELKKCFEESPKYGDLLWVARQRKCTVIQKVRNWMDAESLKLFDACQLPM